MKKLTLLIAALVLSFTAQATIVNCSPNTDAIDWWMTKGDTLVFADGEYIQTYSLDFDKAGIVLMAAEGAKPVIKNSSYFKIHATTTFIGITFDGQNTSNHALTTRGEATKDLILTDCEFKNFVQYNIEIKENTTLTTLNIENCVFDGTNTTPDAIYGKGIVSQTTIQGSEFKNYTEYCIYANDYYGARYDNLTINNCLFHDCAYSAVFLANAKDGLEKQSCSDFTLTNSTIYNVGAASTKGRGVVELRTNSNITSDQEVLIDHVTLYNFASSENAWSGGFYIGNSANSKISNCIAMNPEDKKTLYANPYHAYTGAEITNSLYFNCDYNAEHGATTSESLVKADPKFVDAANADFMLYAESPAVGAGTDGSNLGDPRWGVKLGLKPGSEVLSKAVAAANDGDTIVLGDGEYIERWSYNYNKADLVVMAAEGAKPVIKASSYMRHYATTTFIGITFDGQNTAEYATYSYENTAKDLTFINCHFKNYTKYCITAGSSAHIDKLLINNCIIHDCGNAVYMPASELENNVHTCSDFEMTNSTVYNIEGASDVGAIDVQSNGAQDGMQNKVRIDHVTLYNFLTSGYEGGIKVYKSADAIISNCIVMNPEQKWANPYRLFTGAQIINSLYNNCYVISGAQEANNIAADPLFVDAANANFMLSANSPAVGAGTNGSNLGDTRWGVSASLKGKVITIEPGQQELAAAVGYSVSPGDTIVLKDGTYEEPYSINFNKEGLVVMADEGATPVIALTGEWTALNVSASTTFDGITFDGSNVANYAICSTGTSAKNLIVRNCKFTQYARYNIYGADGTHMDSLVVDNCIFSNSGAAIYFPASTLADNVPGCSYAKVTNSTLYNIILNDYVASIDIQENSNAKQTGNTEVVIDHVTIYNFSSTAKSAIKVYKSGKTNITNSIVANPNAPAEGETIYSYYIYDGAKVQNSLSFNAKGQWASNAYTDTIHADPLFVDPANNNFMLQANSPAIGKATDGTNLGDPRWGVAEPELITLTTGDNDAVIEANIDKTVNVKIERSFTTNDGYYTLCVPFNMPASVIGKAYSLGTITKHVTGEGININLEEESELLAGVPYLVLPKANMSELVVENVTIQSDIASGRNITNEELNVQIFFEGFYSASGRITNGTTEYYVGNNGYLYNGKVEIRGLCGLFTITDTENNPVNVRARVVTREEVETGIDNNQLPNTNIQKVLENGQLIIIRDGVKYNVQGQKL